MTYEVFLGADPASRSGIRVAVTRKGLEVFGWYDSFVGLPGPVITWAVLEDARREVNRVQRKRGHEP